MAEHKHVIFRLGSESYGIPIEAVDRILPEQQVTRIPRSPKLFLGIFDLRGETVPTIDLRTRFELSPTEEPCNFVVVNTNKGRCALRVDEVDGIVGLADEAIEESPDIMKRKDDAFIAGVGKVGGKLIVLVDIDHVVPKEVQKHLQLNVAA